MSDTSRRPGVFVLALLAALAIAPTAWAAPEEIQVYLDDMSDPGKFGLDIHTNLVATGDGTIDEPGAQSSLHRLRVTPEFAYGLGPNLEAGLYLPLATLDGSGGFAADGAKVRLKYIAPKSKDQAWFWGANFEIGRVDHKLDANPWNAEFKGILGRRWGRWTLATNVNVDFKVAGPVSAPATLELATLLTYDLNSTLSLGVESYNGLGEFRRLGRIAEAEHQSFVTLDKRLGRWDVALGLGGGYGANRDGLIVKAIIGVPID